MKNKDQIQIRCDYWETPVVDHRSLWLSYQFYTGVNNYFFFENDIDGPANPIYVLRIGALEPFKISDESDSSIRIDKLLASRPPSHRQRGNTFKVWNSPFAMEACYRLGMTSEEYNETEKFQYVILTNDETIEFVTSNELQWKIYDVANLEELVIKYVKKDFLDSDQDISTDIL